LEYVRLHAKNDFIYPMLTFAAYTGARRSELLRSRRSDFDFESQIVTIRERKRMKGRRSTRRVPLTPKLQSVMENWFENSHPGGPSTFAYLNFVGSPTPSPISVDQAHKIFRQAVDGSKWERIKGWHCLRHSFISNLACAGVDQRMIDDFVGHSTDEMRRRYRHLFPDVKHAALSQVFG
jgi:integrase